jgi:hypothetical protein
MSAPGHNRATARPAIPEADAVEADAVDADAVEADEDWLRTDPQPAPARTPTARSAEV